MRGAISIEGPVHDWCSFISRKWSERALLMLAAPRCGAIFEELLLDAHLVLYGSILLAIYKLSIHLAFGLISDLQCSSTGPRSWFWVRLPLGV